MSMLTAALEQCLEVRWGEMHEVLTDLTAPPMCKEVTQRALEILKTLFNITYSVQRQEVDEVNAALFAIGYFHHGNRTFILLSTFWFFFFCYRRLQLCIVT